MGIRKSFILTLVMILLFSTAVEGAQISRNWEGSGLNYAPEEVIVELNHLAPQWERSNLEMLLSSVGSSLEAPPEDPDTVSPSWPYGSTLTLSNLYSYGVTLSWPAAKDNREVAEYVIYKSGQIIATVDGNKRYFYLNGLAPNGYYVLGVRAKDGAGNLSSGLFKEIYTPSKVTDPAAPIWPYDNLTAYQAEDKSIVMSWSPAEDNVAVTGYRVYQNGELLFDLSGDETSCSVTQLTPNTHYTFKVEAGDAAGNWSSDGPSLGVTMAEEPADLDTDAPIWPEGSQLTATDVTHNSLILSWDEAEDNVGVTGYRIYQGETLLTEGNGISCEVSGLEPETTYTFKVVAGDAAGNWSSDGPSLEVTTGEASVVSDNEAPVWPEGSQLTATDVTHNSLILSWDEAEDNVGVTGYRIYLGETLLAEGYGTSCTISDLDPETAYTFKVEAGDAAGNWSSDGPSLEVITGEAPAVPDTEAPVWPEGSQLTATDVTHDSLLLSWDEAEDNVGVTGYRVYIEETILTEGYFTSVRVLGLDPETPYTFKIEARDAAGNWSSDGPSLTVTTKEVHVDGAVKIYSAYKSVLAEDNQDVGFVKVQNDEESLFEAEGGMVVLYYELSEGATWHGELTEEDFIAKVSGNNIDESLQVEVYEIGENYVEFIISADSDSISSLCFDLPNLNIAPGTQGDVMVWVVVVAMTGEGQLRYSDEGTVIVGKIVDRVVYVSAQTPPPQLEAGTQREGAMITIREAIAGLLDPEENNRIILTSETEGVTIAGVEYSVTGFKVDGATLEDGKTVSFNITEKSQSPGKLHITPYLNIDSNVNGLIKIGVQIGEADKILLVVGQAGDCQAPYWPEGSQLTLETQGTNSVIVKWPAAVDDIGVTAYRIYRNDLLVDTVSGDITSYTVTGLTKNVQHTFKVEAGDAAGNWSSQYLGGYIKITGSPGGGPGGGPAMVTKTTPGDLTKEADIKKNVNPDGTTTLTATVPLKGVTKALTEATRLLLNLEEAEEIVIILPLEAFALMNQKQGELVVTTDRVILTLPGALIDPEAIGQQLGVQPSQGQLEIRIKGVPVAEVKDLPGGLRPLSPVLQLEMTATGGGKTLNLHSFGKAVQGAIPINLDTNVTKDLRKLNAYRYDEKRKIWVYAPSRVEAPGPMMVFATGGPGLFAVMEYTQTFADLQGHWAKEDVELMAAKQVVRGDNAYSFGPDRHITRSEFAAILVRALGLTPYSGQQGQFIDVSPEAWYFSSVETAAQAGLVKGTGAGTFSPNQVITRAEMAVMMMRALALTGAQVQVHPTEQMEILNRFEDRETVPAWAAESVAKALKAGLLHGISDKTLAPMEPATRAQGTAMIRRMMEKGGLM